MSTNTIILTLVIFVLALFKLMVPYKPFKYMLTRWLSGLGELWISINKFVLGFYRGMVWDIELPEGLDAKSRYLVMCNHQSWVDILVLQSCLNRRAPFMRALSPTTGWWTMVLTPFIPLQLCSGRNIIHG
jgi:1-acyl-sn-glycerol-3-phosphate acyltransferase